VDFAEKIRDALYLVDYDMGLPWLSAFHLLSEDRGACGYAPVLV
jgi:hypothetical protein